MTEPTKRHRDKHNIHLTQQRALQLRELAGIKGMKVSELVALWIEREFEELGVTSKFEFCTCTLSPDQSIKVEMFDGAFTKNVTPHEVGAMGEKFLLAAKSDYKLRGMWLPEMTNAEVRNIGPAVQFECGDFRKSMPLDVARRIGLILVTLAPEFTKIIARASQHVA